ncbi:hypothetical protein MVES1_002189 [Malassezia vespertilionis]|uniref:DNA replication regulator SLD2 n=1 Tax=Malassezia vespertilionis TaxID=2020962 RepID=A0A2N1JBN1_9BASI|nr:uncharacterized protein MVES1_002189 [Malassezia vespertilionis]PKI83953.1 hypothetical protein MVES_002065 [Malassezia vespertilionis]WFD06835.1 hypothetical protein MVES1_002189 [Malassezia vespertilionis]
MEAILRKELKQWQREFRVTHGRDPSRTDMQRNPDMALTYDTWHALSQAKGAPKPPKKEIKEARRTAMPAPPTTPTKPRKTIQVQSPGNPFRSPSTPQRTYKKKNDFAACDSDLSEPETSPKRAVPTPTKPKKTPPQIFAYTPRTKARKRLRGEDVRTPPHARLPRYDVQSRASLLLAQSPSKRAEEEEGPQAKRRIFSSRDTPLEIPNYDAFGPSPRKRTQASARGFRPFFRTASTADVPASPQMEMDVCEEAAPSSQSIPQTPFSPTQTSQTSATTQVPLPASSALALDVETNGASVMVLPYQRFGSVRTRRGQLEEHDALDALEWAVRQAQNEEAQNEEAQEPVHEIVLPDLDEIEYLSLVSPKRYGQRAEIARRQRAAQLVEEVVAEDTTSGIDCGASESDDHHDDDWASETSSVEYGLGDGEMDSADVL